jgi:hypothetical protein
VKKDEVFSASNVAMAMTNLEPKSMIWPLTDSTVTKQARRMESRRA